MNNFFKAFILVLTITILTSCNKKDTNVETNNNDLGGVATVNTNNSNKDKKTIYDAENKVLNVWNNVKIKAWINESFPKYIKIYKDNTTHINSNVPNYIFFIADKDDKLSNIVNFYKELFKKLWYKDLSKINKEEVESSQNLEFVLENPKYKEVTEEDLKNPSFLIPNERKYLQKILIQINKEVPEIIKNNMGLDGFFVEIYYNQI